MDRDGRVGPRTWQLLKRVAHGGVDPELRHEVWPLLLGLRDPTSTAVETEQGRRERREAYRALRERCVELEEMRDGKGIVPDPAAANGHRRRTEPLPEELGTFTENAPVIRADVPRTPLRRGAYATHWEAEQRAKEEERAGQVSGRGSDGWTRGTSSTRSASSLPASSSSSGGGTADGEARSWQAAQAKRLASVLHAYALHDPEVGYCQGMNEVAAMFLEHIPDESEAFWCFERFLRAYRSHFIISSPAHQTAAIQGDRVTVRHRLVALGDILRRQDPPLWKHVQLLGAGDCMFAFRAVVALMSRELPPAETAFLWEALMAAGDHMLSPCRDQALEGEGEGRDGGSRDSGSGQRNGTRGTESGRVSVDDPANRLREGARDDRARRRCDSSGDERLMRPEEGAGGGRMFLHVVAASFMQARNLIFACHEFDDLLHASHHAIARRNVGTAELLASARRCMVTTPRDK